MGFKCGLVGLPNVGKSTIFNVITNTANAQAANYPFCTIEPNVGRVAVGDPRLIKLKDIANSARIVPNYIDIVDIAGLVKGASNGEGLGNQFLGHIREVDAILHVVRAFEDDDIVHVNNIVSPIDDIRVIEEELLLADLGSLQKRMASIGKKQKAGDEEAVLEAAALQKAIDTIDAGKMARFADCTPEEWTILKRMNLLTAKPMLYVVNVEDANGGNGPAMQKIMDYATQNKAVVVKICAKLESEMLEFEESEKKAFLLESGFVDTGLNQIVMNGYQLLGLVTFFTVGEQEARAWSVKQNSCASVAAGVIHSDFEKHFIKAEVVSYQDFVDCAGVAGARDAGKLRMEGKEYVVRDGDVVNFKTGA